MNNSSGTLDDRYLTWLYRKIGPLGQRNPARSYFLLSEHMHKTEFLWSVPNDDNRVEDGKALRVEFVEEEEGGQYDRNWMELECSVLEMLIALSRRLAFEAGDSDFEWFWRLVENLDLIWVTDNEYDNGPADIVDETLHRLIFRKYDSDGRGGLFPLSKPTENQRNVEIFYQMAAYLLERS